MQPGNRSNEVRTHELLVSFGWSDEQRYHQQDVNEFSDQLADILEQQMGKNSADAYRKLFYGTFETVMSCINVRYESRRDEKFNSLQLDVHGNETIEDCIRQYLSVERLDGENQYETEQFGK